MVPLFLNFAALVDRSQGNSTELPTISQCGSLRLGLADENKVAVIGPSEL